MNEKQDITVEMEYREWRESPLWYCVKTVLNNITGIIKSEIITDEKTKLPITVQDFDKPLDGVYETSKETIYYAYYQGYKQAESALTAARV
jgi:hypothetical protein